MSALQVSGTAGSISFVLMVNKQGQTRLASYYEWMSVPQRVQLEGEIIRRCITRPPEACQILHIRGYCVVYRRYASLFFIVGCLGKNENELETLEFIHCLVETMDRYFESVCELDIMFNLEKAHMILDEMVANGVVFDANKASALNTVHMVEKVGKEKD